MMNPWKPRLICFDLDGTLYQDRSVYRQLVRDMFAGKPQEPWTEPILSQMERILAGEETLQCGRFVPKLWTPQPQTAQEVFAVQTVSAWEQTSLEDWGDRSRYSYLGDGWTLAMYAARRIGWEGDRFWKRFRQIHSLLLEDPYGPPENTALAACFQQLREQGVKLVLCTNSQPEGGGNMLRRLGLAHCFDAVYFDANKPHSFAGLLAEWGANWYLQPREMLFVGDQGYFDLYAGKHAGGRTWLISPDYQADASLFDLRMRTTDELTARLQSLAQTT